MSATKIEFAHESLNFMAGCTKCSAGCKNCWAVRMAHRHGANPKLPQYEGLTYATPGSAGPQWTGKMRWFDGVAERAIVRLALARNPLRIVYNLMGDIAHPQTPEAWLDRSLAFCGALPMHKHIFITKRPGTLRERLEQLAPNGRPKGARWDAARRPLYDACYNAAREKYTRHPGTPRQRALMAKGKYIGMMLANPRWPLPNLMLMATCEDQEQLEARAPDILRLGLAGWHVGIIHEPLLGPLDWSVVRVCDEPPVSAVLGTQSGPQWVVLGHEQGPGKREVAIQHSGSIVSQCAREGVPCFFKKDSSGSFPPDMPRQFPKWMEV